MSDPTAPGAASHSVSTVQRPLRITIVTGPWFPTPPGPSGAVERVWGDLARHFAQRGHEVTLLSRSFEGLPAREVRDGVRTLRATAWRQGRNVKLDLVKDVFFSGRMFTLVPEGDICVTNAFWLPVMLARFKPRAGKVVMSVQRGPKGQFKLYREVHRITAVSRAIADAICAEEPSLAARVRSVPNPVDLAYFRPGATRAWRTGDATTRTVLYTGRIHPEKGLHVLVRAFASLHAEFPDLRLRLVGPSRVDRGGGGEEYLAQLRSLAPGAPVAIDDPIYDRARLAEAIQQASYYCYPSLAEQGEAFGVAPVEAMATGLAPVLSDLAVFREFCVPEENGLIFDHRGADPAGELARALRRLVVDPALSARLGARAAQDATRFGYDQVARAYLEDFRTLVA